MARRSSFESAPKKKANEMSPQMCRASGCNIFKWYKVAHFPKDMPWIPVPINKHLEYKWQKSGRIPRKTSFVSLLMKRFVFSLKGGDLRANSIVSENLNNVLCQRWPQK
ncbi:hypothetical protein PO909_006985 [Leuciscus waleckii]